MMVEEKKTRVRKPATTDVKISKVEYEFLMKRHQRLEAFEEMWSTAKVIEMGQPTMIDNQIRG